MEILRKYEADFPKIYVQAEQNGIRVELAFDHDPSVEEIQIIMDEITKQPEVIDGDNNIS